MPPLSANPSVVLWRRNPRRTGLPVPRRARAAPPARLRRQPLSRPPPLLNVRLGSNPTIFDSERVSQLRQFGNCPVPSRQPTTGGQQSGVSGIFGNPRGHEQSEYMV